MIGTSHYRAGQYGEAESLFVQIGDEANETSGVRLRAVQMLVIIRQNMTSASGPAEAVESSGEDTE